VLAAIPNVGEDDDFSREQSDRRGGLCISWTG
jgi:hypothetical protein